MDNIINKIKRDKYYFVISFSLIILIILLHVFRQNFIATVDIHLTSLKIFGNYYDLNLFDGVMFTSFIIITMFTAWYFGGHAAFMFVAISWNFEVALFIVLTGRYELVVEFINIFFFVFLYVRESPADKKRRLQQEMVENTNLQLLDINKAFRRFVPTEFINLIGKKSITDLSAGDSIQQNITIMFADIRSFSTISQSIPPKELFDFLNSFLKEIGPVIRKNNGFIDKYLGDGIMAIFPDCPSDALDCAIDMNAKLKSFNQKNQNNILKAIRIGTGIHTGVSILGTLGEEERIETTVISEAVNLSCRLEELTKTYGVEIIVSHHLLESINSKSSKYISRYLDNVVIRGSSTNCNIYELIADPSSPLSSLKILHKDLFEHGVKLSVNKLYEEAAEVFKELHMLSPNDEAVKYHLQKNKYQALSE
ncbi:MAG: adenylate/guanylate cyclase domain-containing protein [Bacteroidota bacterium]